MVTIRRVMTVLTATFAATAAVVPTAVAPTAGAVAPPHVDEHATPPPGSVGPVAAMGRRGECVTAGVLPGTDPGAPGPGHTLLNVPGAWAFSRGEGQTVAVGTAGFLGEFMGGSGNSLNVLDEEAELLRESGQTVIFVGVDEKSDS